MYMSLWTEKRLLDLLEGPALQRLRFLSFKALQQA